MTEKTTYTCDYCGQEFDNEENCIAHEKEELFKQYEDRVALFDDGGILTDDIERCFTVYVADMDAFRYVNGLLSDAGYCGLWDFEDQMQKGPNTFYYQWGDWRCLGQDLNELLKLEKNVKEALDNRPKM